MANPSESEETDQAAPTPDGERIDVEAMNLGFNQQKPLASKSKLAKWYRNISLFFAGMHTGVSCGGTPHSHHTYTDDKTRRDHGPL